MSYPARRFYLPLPPATKTLFLINVAVFLLNAVLVGRLSDPAEGAWFAFSWSGVWEGYGLGFLRLVTYQFTHSFRSPTHLLMNMVVLWFFGPLAEGRLGRLGVYRLYLWGGFVGALLHLAVASFVGYPNVPLVGASGACYALLVYCACVAPTTEVIFIIMRVQLWALAALLCFLGLYSLYVEIVTGYSDAVAHGAHLGGALLGLVAWRLAWFVDYESFGGRPATGWLTRLRQRWRARAQDRARAVQAEREGQLDEILAKVKRTGLDSLTPAERKFLERLSQRSRDR